MAATLVQSANGTTSVVLNGVTAGNLIVVVGSFYRNPSTGVTAATPTDSQGTYSVASAPTPSSFGGGDMGSAIWYQQNVAAGTHTITPESESFLQYTAMEFSGILTSGALDVVAHNQQTGDHTSKDTGTTATTAQGEELVVIVHGMGANTGNSNVGYTDPVSGFTTVRKLSDTATTITIYAAYDIIAAIGTQTATFDWTAHESVMASQANIATFKASAVGGSVALTGTATGSITETDVRNGGKTIILTVTGDTYVAAGTGPIGSIADTLSLINGIDSGQAEATGWDALVKPAVRIPGDVVRTSGTVATITLPGVVDYNITAQETVTATVPGAVLTGANPLVAAPTFTVSSDGSTPGFQDLTGAMVGM